MGEKGQALVEFALILPALLFLVLGGVDLARGYFVNQAVLNAARQAARVGILPTGTAADSDAAVTSVLNDAGLCSPTCPSGLAVSIANAGSEAPPGALTTVTVSYPFDTALGNFVPGWSGTIPLTQTVRMRHE